MNLFQSIVLGAVEGITEFLPISSTAHLMIAAELIGLGQNTFVKSFEIAVQLGAVMAVLFLYVRRVVAEPDILWKVLTGFIPTAIIGFALYSFAKEYLLGNFVAMFWALLIGGIVLVVVEMYEKRYEKRKERYDTTHATDTGVSTITYPQAAIVGLIQVIAIIPGVSRSAATIIGGRLLGLSKTAALEFSFLLALPTIASAALYDISKNLSAFSGHVTVSIVGFLVSFITAILAIKFLLSFVRTHSFIPFGIYRIALAGAVLFFIL